MSKELTREEWIEEKRKCLGASDAAKVLGLSKYGGPYDVWASKVHGYSVEQTEPMIFGLEVEPAIASMYARKTGRIVTNPGDTLITYAPGKPWLGATLDRVTVGSETYPAPDWVSGEAALELKSVGRRDLSPEKWENEGPPHEYWVQLQIQMYCIGADWGSLAGLFPGYQLAIKDYERDDNFLADAIPKLEKFWKEHVETGIAPEPEDNHRLLDVVKKTFRPNPSKEVVLNEEAARLWDGIKSARKLVSEHSKCAKKMEAKLRILMEDANLGTLPDGTVIQLVEVKRKGYTVKDSSYTQLKEQK